MRDYYNRQLSELEQLMSEMGQMIEVAIEEAMTALLQKDQEKGIIQRDCLKRQSLFAFYSIIVKKQV